MLETKVSLKNTHTTMCGRTRLAICTYQNFGPQKVKTAKKHKLMSKWSQAKTSHVKKDSCSGKKMHSNSNTMPWHIWIITVIGQVSKKKRLKKFITVLRILGGFFPIASFWMNKLRLLPPAEAFFGCGSSDNKFAEDDDPSSIICWKNTLLKFHWTFYFH